MTELSAAGAARHFDELIDAMEVIGLCEFAAPGRRMASDIDASLEPALLVALEANPAIQPKSYLDFWQLPDDLRRGQDLQDSYVERWRQALEHVASPRSRAKLADLIWCAQPSDSAAATTAIEAYHESAQAAYASSAPAWSDWDPALNGDHVAIFRVDRWSRARQIAIATKNDSARSLIEESVRIFIEDEMQQGRWTGALQGLGAVGEPTRLRPAWVADVVTRSANIALGAGADARSPGLGPLLELAVAHADTAQGRKDVSREIVNAWIRAADDASEVDEYGILQHAYQRAVDLGHPDLATQIAARRANIDPSRFITRIRSETPVDSEFLGATAAQIDIVMAAPDLTQWFLKMSSFGLPTGDLVALIAETSDQVRNKPDLEDSITTHIFGDRQHIAVGDDAKIRLKVARHAQISAPFIAVFLLVPAFERLGVCIRNEEFSVDDAWNQPFIEPLSAERLRRGFTLYLDGDADSAAHLLIPTFESVMRTLVKYLGLPVGAPARQGKDGMQPLLGDLLSQLEGWVPEPLRLYWKMMLIDFPGFNWRNDIAHGLSPKFDQVKGSLVAHLCGTLAWPLHQLKGF